MGAYLQPTDLAIALGKQKYVAYFDDDRDGTVDDDSEIAAVNQVIMRAEARMVRYAAEIEGFTLPTPTEPAADAFRAIALEYAITIAEARVSAVSRQDAEKRLNDLDADMKDLARGLTRIEAPGLRGFRSGLPSDEEPPPGNLQAGLVAVEGTGPPPCPRFEYYRREGR